MDEFASSSMIRLLQMGLGKQGISVPASSALTSGAAVALNVKRELLEEIMQVHGPAILLKATDIVHEITSEPLLLAVLAARDTSDLLARWCRLEQFAHSHHRVQWQCSDDAHITLSHVSIREHKRPTLAENLVIYGLLTNLIEANGAHDLIAQPAAAKSPWRKNREWSEVYPLQGISSWVIQCTFPTTPPISEQEAPAWGSLCREVKKLLHPDLLHRWTLEEMASIYSLTPRSFQRLLRSENSTFSQLVRQVRIEHAAAMLVEGQQDIATIGYLCGFSDQAHFTRQFRNFTGTTPGHYRLSFRSE